MSVWTERIKEHKVWDALKLLGTAIDAAASWEKNSVDEVTGIERLREILAFTGKRLAATDPFLLSVTALTDLTTKLEDVTHDLDVSNDVESANAEGDKLLVLIADILAPIPSEDLNIINESLTTYRNAITKKLKDALKSQDELSESIDAHKTALDEHIIALEEERDILKKHLVNFKVYFQQIKTQELQNMRLLCLTFQQLLQRHRLVFKKKLVF